MPQEQQKRPQPKPQRALTPEELQRFSETKFTPSQIQLIWKRKMPVDANLEDFEMFLYVCASKELDPLLGEVFCRLQFERDTGELKLLILDSIHGMLKSADKTKELNGIETTIEVDDGGNIISATATVHRKGCEFPFRATAYWDEYNANTFIWKQKPRVMITKCATALALRLAFASALAGIYVPEEFERSDNAPAEANIEFAVGEIVSDVKTEVQRLDPDVASTSASGSQPSEPVSPIIPQTEPPKEKIDAPAMPINLTEVRNKNAAMVQRLMLDLEIAKEMRQPLLTAFYSGFLGVATMPKDATVFTPALEALSAFSDSTRNARIEFVADAKGLGQRLRDEKELENAPA